MKVQRECDKIVFVKLYEHADATRVCVLFLCQKIFGGRGHRQKWGGERMARRGQMSERDKRIVRDYYFADMTMEKIGEREGMTAAGVHKLLHSQKGMKYLEEIQEKQGKKARAFLVGQTMKAARTMAELMDGKDPYARIQAARDVLDRAGIKQEENGGNVEIEMPVQVVIGMPEELVKDEDNP